MESLVIQKNQPLSRFSTFRIGGPARYFTTVSNLKEMKEALAFCRHNSLKFFVLGKGSNSLFDDQGYDGLVIYNQMEGFKDLGEGHFEVESGFSFALLGTRTAKQGLSGLEFASGIPGTVGGAIYMNAGANEKETCDVLEKVLFLHEDGREEIFSREQLAFCYRKSPFHHMKGAILSGIFHLQENTEAQETQRSFLRYRVASQPYGQPSAGCVFRNPKGEAAGALIERLGLKGLQVGGAMVSEKHGNFIVNTGDATSQDVLHLVDQLRQKVRENAGVDLEPEVHFVPYQSKE